MKRDDTTNLRLNAWIRAALRQIRLPLTRRTLRQEFLDHFEDCRDALLDQGLSERQADEKALEHLGSAREVGKLLKLVYRPKIYLVRAAILLLALLYLVPWPTRITRQFYGQVYWMDGTPAEPVSFTVQGWKLDYLFKDDRLDLELNWDRPEDGGKLFPPALMDPQEALGYETIGFYYDGRPGIWGSSFGPVYPSKELFHSTYTLGIADFELSRDCTSCMLDNQFSGWYILAANNPGANETELRALYADNLESFLSGWNVLMTEDTNPARE